MFELLIENFVLASTKLPGLEFQGFQELQLIDLIWSHLTLTGKVRTFLDNFEYGNEIGESVMLVPLMLIKTCMYKKTQSEIFLALWQLLAMLPWENNIYVKDYFGPCLKCLKET